MASYSEWYAAISGGRAVKESLLQETIRQHRESSTLSPEETEHLLEVYEKYSLANFRIGEKNRGE